MRRLQPLSLPPLKDTQGSKRMANNTPRQNLWWRVRNTPRTPLPQDLDAPHIPWTRCRARRRKNTTLSDIAAPTVLTDRNSPQYWRKTPPGNRDDARKTTPDTDTGHFSGKCDDAPPQTDARYSLTSSLANVREDDTMEDMDTPLSQHDETHKQ